MLSFQSFKKTLKHRLQLAYATTNVGIKETRPDFICIGSPRSGTTWLSSVINQHPDFCKTTRKEMHFFDTPIYQKVNEKKTDINSSFYGKYFDMDNKGHWRWYYSQFNGCQEKIKGDITPAYSRLPEDRVRFISQHLPDIKLIYMMRNPIERAWSGVRYFAPDKFGKTVDELSTDEIINFVMMPRRLIGGNYADVIQLWNKYFNDSKIHYIFYDDLSTDPFNQAESVCQFLGADSSLLKNAESYRKKVNASSNNITMPDAVFTALRDYYQDQIVFLSKKFNRNFDHWLDN